MSMMYCNHCDKHIDTDLEYDHFIDSNMKVCHHIVEDTQEISKYGITFFMDSDFSPVCLMVGDDYYLPEDSPVDYSMELSAIKIDLIENNRDDFKEFRQCI